MCIHYENYWNIRVWIMKLHFYKKALSKKAGRR